MIIIYTGLTGSCKTAAMTLALYREWKRGATIYSNYPLFFDSNERIVYWSSLAEIQHVSDGIIAMDEAQALLDSHNWRSLPTSFSNKLSQHRKHLLDIYCTTQNINLVDLRLRNLVGEWWHCEKIFRLPNEDRVKPFFQLSTICKMEKKEAADGRLLRYKTKTNLFIIWPWFRRLYNTYGDIGLNRCLLVCKYREKKMKALIVSRQLTNKMRF
jgi:hypothetical protein